MAILKKRTCDVKAKLRAFSLVELAAVLTIISIITAALLVLANNKINEARLNLTRKKMEVIESAIQSYVKQYGHLPCPAGLTLASNSQYYGWGVSTGTGDCSTAVSGATSLSGSSNVFYGLVPFKTINSSLDPSISVDSWGNKILYIVDQRYSSTAGYGTYNKTSSDTDLIIRTRASGGNTIEGAGSGLGNSLPESKKVAYILLSYGPNGFYAMPDKSTTPNIASNDANEMENGNGDNVFVQRLIDNNFDDILRYKTRYQLE